jgi:hypothetical protein
MERYHSGSYAAAHNNAQGRSRSLGGGANRPISCARPAIEDDEILTEKLHEEPLIIALPGAFEREWQQPLPIASLRDATFVLYPHHPRPSFADRILSVCSAAGFRPHNPVMACGFRLRANSRATVMKPMSWGE